ncbi:MAG: YqgE/AlgH family protein [Verrucomicrobia bacterium]|jgi:putative transcriptional regulator|nr:YqgE/AlgH family protein [Verrucomicrobiota bacterium]
MAEKPKYLKGQLLLDGGNLVGSWFHRTVVLICDHDEKGAFGLVLNRDSGRKAGDAIIEDLPEQVRELAVYIGGPVQPGAMSFLYTDDYLPDGNVLPNVSLSHSLEDLVAIGDSFSPTQKIRLFAGYAGWAPGQLESEMRRKSWLAVPATPALIFPADPSRLWQEILAPMGWKYRLLANSPDDLSRN